MSTASSASVVVGEAAGGGGGGGVADSDGPHIPSPQPPSPSSFGVVTTALQSPPPPSPSLSSFVASSPDADPALEACSVMVCGTGAAVAIFSNKYPGVYATHCATAADAVNTHSINACNVLALSGMATPPDAVAAIADAWLTTPFRAPCPVPCARPPATPHGRRTSSASSTPRPTRWPSSPRASSPPFLSLTLPAPSAV
uniref:Uncharacterized protein n=1 Tax=Oryza rufipogon TaxID=4529 RepID=A0A0E0QR88_ORYRU